MKTVDKPRITLQDLKSYMSEAMVAGDMEQIKPPLEHYHTSDLYGRRIFVPGGTVIVTKVHKVEHITVALKGSCTVVDEHGIRYEVVAPSVFVTKPGTRRAVYAHDDVEWLTVHACKEQDVKVIEQLLVCEDPPGLMENQP